MKRVKVNLQLFAEEEPTTQELGTVEEPPAADGPEKTGDATVTAKAGA